MNRLNQWKHWPKFWQLVREHGVCPESDYERLGECEIHLVREKMNSNNIQDLCAWPFSGFAGNVMFDLVVISDKIRYIDLSTYAQKTAPLPIVRPCHRCDTHHDEANPPPFCAALLERDQRIAELEVLVVKAFYAGQKYGFDDAGSVGNSSHEITAQNLDEFLLENGIKQTPPTEAQNG